MYIDKSLSYEVIEKSSNEAFQALWIEISFVQKKNIIVGVIYRQHNSPHKFKEYFDEVIEKFTATGKSLCIMGDFNLDLLKIESSCYSRDFFLSLQSCYLIPSIDKPTRVYNNSATLIDNIFINMPERVTISGNIISDITDHFSQFCIFKSTKDKIEIPIKQQRRDFSQFSAVNFNNELSLIDWDEIFLKGDRDIDKTFCFIYKRINAILNKHAPIKLISRRQAKRLSKPWITKGIRTAIKHKNQLYADGKQSEYKIYRNRIQRLIRLSKANYYCEYFNKHLTNMKKT